MFLAATVQAAGRINGQRVDKKMGDKSRVGRIIHVERNLFRLSYTSEAFTPETEQVPFYGAAVSENRVFLGQLVLLVLQQMVCGDFRNSRE